MRTSGIYRIVGLIDGKEYIGSAVNMYQRWHHHKHHLCGNKHTNSKLQRYVNKYGLENIEFQVLEKCKKDLLVTREQFYLDQNKPYFNICRKAGSSLGYRFSDEQKAKFSEMRKGKTTTGMLGKKHNSKTKKLISAKAKERGLHPNFKAASIKANTGRVQTKEEIEKRSISQAKITPEQAVRIRKMLDEGSIQTDLAEEYGVSQRVISRVKNMVGIYGEDYYKAACERFDLQTRQQALAI